MFLQFSPGNYKAATERLHIACSVITSSVLTAKLRASEGSTAALLWAAPDLWGEFITQTTQRWFQYLLGSLFCIRLIWKTVDSCPLYTNEGWPSDWAEATFIMWRSITFLWGNGFFFFSLALPMHMEQQPGPIANERAHSDMMYTVCQYGTDVF